MRLYLATALLLATSCKSPAPQTQANLSGLSVDRDATNIAVFLGFPAGDAWISNNLPNVKNAVEDPDIKYGFKTHMKDQATRAEALEWIKNSAAGVGENGTLLVMLAGHGSPDGLIQTHDRQFMNFREVSRAIADGRNGRGRLKRLVMVIFSCYSGNWVNGAPAIGDSDSYPAGKVDLAMGELASKTADSAAQAMAAEKSRNVGLYEQLLVMTSSTRAQLSWGSEFTSRFAEGFAYYKKNHRDTARIKTLIDYIVSKTTSSQPQYRGFPTDVVYNDYLFHDSPDENLFASMTGGKLVVSATDAVASVKVCDGTLAQCRSAEQGKDGVAQGVTGDRKLFAIEDFSPADGKHFTVLARLPEGRLVSTRTFVAKPASEADGSGEWNGLDNRGSLATDQDADGVDDKFDYCTPTEEGAAVTKTGKWSGCTNAQSQQRESLLADAIDTDADGISDRYDKCPATPQGESAFGSQYPQWAGCSQKQYNCKAYRTDCPPANPDGDDDEDGVKNGQDKCPGTPGGMNVWKSDDADKVKWKGCAQGQSPQ